MNQEMLDNFCELFNAIQVVADYAYEISGDLLQMEKETGEKIEHTKTIYDSAVKVRSFIDGIFFLVDKDKPIN